MSNSSLGNKIQDLQARIKAEIDSKDDLSPGAFMVPRPGSARKPKILGEIPLRSEGTPTRSRKQLDLPFMIPQKQETSEADTKLQEIMKRNGILKINGLHYNTALTDMEHLGDLGNGTCGHVVKMLHKPSDTVIAVKQMRRSGNAEENKRIIMDIEVVLKSHDCPYIVQCLGCFISASDVWICMELMSTCFDKLLKRLKQPIPEDILGKVTVATVKALSYLKERHGVIHRDVKPSNILLDERGRIKLCDFGISGRLVDSKAKTRSAGCAAYMAPERIDPPDPNRPDYDIRADVWSLGITLVELATGRFPYRDCSTDFEVLTRVLQEAPPSLPSKGAFSKDFQTFVTCCLTKNYKDRPKYAKLLNHDFVKYYEKENVSVDKWFSLAMHQADMLTNQRRFTSPPPSPNTRRHFAFHTRTPSEPRNQPDFQTQLELRNTPERLITNGTSVYNDLEVRSNGPSRSFTPNDFTLEGERVNNLPPINRMNKVSNSVIHQHDPRDTYNINNVYERNQISPFLSRRPVPEPEPTNGFWQVPQGSPLANRKRFQVFPDRFGPVQTSPRVLSGNTSPIVLERFYHQQNQRHAQAQQALVTHPPLAHEVAHLSPQHNEKEQGAVKRRFASYIKVHLGGHGRSTSPQSPGGAHAAGGVGAVVNHDRRRHQSPDPPPRYNRGTSETGASPLPLRRNYMDLVNVNSGSPNLLRRYPPVPQPPPRRLSESSSTPASPQHLRTRLHFTPEPLRRHYPPPELS